MKKTTHKLISLLTALSLALFVHIPCMAQEYSVSSLSYCNKISIYSEEAVGNVQMIVAAYSKNKLVDVATDTVTLNKGDNLFNRPELDFNGADTLKIMVWDALGSMKPITVTDDYIAYPEYNSTPLFVTYTSTASVDGSPRTALTGYVGDEVVGYNFAENVDYYNMEGELDNENVVKPSEFDAIQFILNSSNEIVAYRHLVDVDGTNVKFMVSEDMENDFDAKKSNAKIVQISYDKWTDKADFIEDNHLFLFGDDYQSSKFTSVSETKKLSGYGAFGFPYTIDGDSMRMFYNLDSRNDAEENYIFVDMNSRIPMYILSTNLSDNYEVGSVEYINSWDSEGSKFTEDYKITAEQSNDAVYIFRYDDETIFQMALDLGADYR